MCNYYVLGMPSYVIASILTPMFLSHKVGNYVLRNEH